MSNNETNMAWVARDESIIAPCQHLSYFPMVIDHVDHDMIYDVEGKLIFNQYVVEEQSVALPSSTYIVRGEQDKIKVVKK